MSMLDSNKYISSSAAVEKEKDSTRKFIRTADLKFKVRNVIQSTYAIENITNNFGGFVTYTNLNSTIDNKTSTPVSDDSSLETTHFTIANTITIRVPNTKLDTTLKSIASFIEYMDFRVIKADDVALNILANRLIQERATGTSLRLSNAIERRGKKLNETTNAEDHLLSRQEQADDAKIANMSLKDQVNFSTITLAIYQRQGVKQEVVATDKCIAAYTPGLGKRIMESFKNGWEMLVVVFVFVARMWGFVLFGLLGYFIFRKYGLKLKKN